MHRFGIHIYANYKRISNEETSNTIDILIKFIQKSLAKNKKMREKTVTANGHTHSDKGIDNDVDENENEKDNPNEPHLERIGINYTTMK